MRKIIQPKRLNKNVTVDQYWDIRNKLKAPKKSLPIQAYRQQQVANRFRYLKPTQQAKQFNPLNYFFKSSARKTQQEQQYAAHFKDQQSTHTHEIFSSFKYRVSGPLIPIKKLVFGLKSIIYNHQTILNILLSNLECDESWPVLQAIIKDTKQHSFEYWMKNGLQKLAYQKQDQNGAKVSIYSNHFNQKKFQNLFDTLSVFMESNYERIMQNLKQYFTIMNKYFFNHNNKYIRKFSMKSVSYIINNLSLEDNLTLIFNIVLNSSIKTQQQIPIGEILLNRHKAVKGCLSSVQINNVIQTLKQLPHFMTQNFNQSQMQSQSNDYQQFNQNLKDQIQNIISVYISGILDLLETKFGKGQQNQGTNEILFDLNYCIKAFIGLQQKADSNIQQITIIKGFRLYLQNCDQKRFLTHNYKHQTYINETFELILNYLQNSLIKIMQRKQKQSNKETSQNSKKQVGQQVSKLIGCCFKLCPKITTKFILSKGVIHYSKQMNEQKCLDLVQKINNSDLLSSLDSNQCKSLGQYLLISFSKFIKSFFESKQTNNQLLYTLYIILKKINFNNTINLSYLSLDKNLLIHKISTISNISNFFIFSKLTTLLNLQTQKDSSFSSSLSTNINKTFQSLINPFTQSLQSIINSNYQQNSTSIFSYNNHIQDLLRYSHHQVEWVNVAYNLQECCKVLMNKLSLNKQATQKWIWSDLSLNRIIQIDQKLTLNNLFQSSLILLQSRNRQARKSILQRILNLWNSNQNSHLKTIVQRLHTIDSDDIDIDNQRDIKKQFGFLQQQVSQLKSTGPLAVNIIKLMSNWVLGFCFTGFKLINDNIVSFTHILLDLFPSQTSQIFFPFISYYIYRHSRQFEYDMTQNQVFVLKTPKKVESLFNSIKEQQKLYSLIKQDFNIQNQNTIQWIGLQRIGHSIGRSRKFKNNNQQVKNKLQDFLKSYFSQQFFRKINTLSAHKADDAAPNSHLITQPKTRFLTVMLKLCPQTYLPPYQCLHYLSPQYLCLQSVHIIKKNRWQALWVKKLKGSKSKQQITDTVNTTISLQKMSMEQQYLYSHFLWKQLLEGNQQKRRSIFEHIRDRVPDIIPYMFNNILYKEMLFIKDGQRYFEQIKDVNKVIGELKAKLGYENKKTLLNMMYLLKAMMVVFKNFLRNSSHLSYIVIILRCLIQLVYKKQQKINNQQEQQRNEQIQNEQQEQQQAEQQNNQEDEQKEQKDSYSLYKPHRKQLYKVLTQLFTHYSLQYQQADSLLTDLSQSYLQIHQNNSNLISQKVFSKIAYASVNSVPGILILFKVISQQSFYHHLLLKFGILDLVASIIDINDVQSDNEQKAIPEQKNNQQDKNVKRKKQSNPHAINTCLDILSNILNIHNQQKSQSIKMQQQQQSNYIQSHWTKWIHPLQQLLNSINHYFLYSKNLSQKSLNNSSYLELDYYSNQNRQNVNSIHNNKNKYKKENDRQLNQGKNLDLMWQIVGQIVLLNSISKNTLQSHPQNKQNKHQIVLGSDWEQIFWGQINKIVKVKQFKQKQYIKLFKIIQISLIYFNQKLNSASNQFSNKLKIQQFLCKIISVLPHINQLSQRTKLTQIIHKSILSTTSLRLIDQQAINLVTSINSVKKNGLNIQIDYDLFFGAINQYSQANTHFKKSQQMIDQNIKQLNLISHQYIIYNLLPYLTSEQLSVRKAIRQALNSFLIRISVHLKQFQNQTLKVFNSILRLLIQQLKRNQIDNVFWSILGSIGLFIRFSFKFTDKFQKAFQNMILYTKLLAPLVRINNDEQKGLTFESENQQDFFHMITSISQGNKMRALKMLKQRCISLKQQNISALFRQQQKGSSLPHPLPFLLTSLQHLILPIKHFQNQNQYNVQGNLTSTLTHISLQIYEHIIPYARQSLIKKELKRLSTKIKFNQQQKSNQQNLKRNILIIKIISSIVEGIQTLEKCTVNIKKYISQYGFDQFHSKLIKNARTLYQQTQQQQEQDSDQQDLKKNPQLNPNHLEQLESQQAINRNFMMFDKKLLTMQQKQQQQQSKSKTNSSLINFLKLHILIPLKLMLFYQNKSTKQAKQQQDKSRMMISVAITKLLIKFPMDMFLFQFQKILSKICRLLKKRKLQVRQNGRKSLCQIAKIVGPEMLYAIVLQLKFHLRDNFQKHIFNYTVYQIIQTLSPLKHGQIDYCLPLILPMMIDQIFGQSSEQKKMVQLNQVPVLNMQTKKKKGNQLLVMISRQISVDRIRYLIQYLQKFLKQFLNSQTNLSKYDLIVNNLMNGLGQNQQFTNQTHAGIFGKMLCQSMYQLRKQIKIYNFEQQKQKITHQTTLKVNNQKQKKTGKQSLLLQQQAGRNGSIFKKMSKQVTQKRNKQIMINSLVQLYLALGSLLIKKQVISIKTLQQNKYLVQNYIKIIQFVFQCMDHRDNRIVCKCMRLLHQALIINYEKSNNEQLKENIKSLRKKVSRKILLFIQKLTSNDTQLLKQTFTILIDLFSHVVITKQFLSSIITIIKLHTNNQSQQYNIAQPYKLLKLLIYKLPSSIYNPLIYDMYQFVRINIVNSNISQIRDICKNIAMTYVRNKQYLITGIQLNKQSHTNNQSHKHNSNKSSKSKQIPKSRQLQMKEHNIEHQYSQRIKKQLNFYLSNLDCKRQQNQLLVLQIIQQFVNNRSKPQLEEVSQLILLSLATSIINGNQCVQKINKIIFDIVKVIDKTKIYQLIEKTIVWIAQSRQKAQIRQCGYLLLNIILNSKIISIDNQTFKNQYLLKSNNNILSSISSLLNEQVNILTDYLISKKQNTSKKVQSKQWNSILDAIDVQQTNPYLNNNKILQYCLDVLTSLSQSNLYQQKLKQQHIVSLTWKLLKTPQNIICQKGINFLSKINNLCVHLNSQVQSQHLQSIKIKQEQVEQNNLNIQNKIKFNLKSTIATLINNQISKQTILILIQKCNSQPLIGDYSFIQSFQLLLSFINKLVMKFKIMESKAQPIYYLLNQSVVQNKQQNHLIFNNQQLLNKIIDALGKVSRNQFVTVQCKTLNQQSINLVKQIVGVTDFYKKLTKLQSQRRQKKSQQKANLARLAVTDQKAYIDAKKKKIKTQQH